MISHDESGIPLPEVEVDVDLEVDVDVDFYTTEGIY